MVHFANFKNLRQIKLPEIYECTVVMQLNILKQTDTCKFVLLLALHTLGTRLLTLDFLLKKQLKIPLFYTERDIVRK